MMEGYYSGEGYDPGANTWTPTKSVDPIESAADDVLILELIKRGYAVAKMPADKLAEIAE